MENQLNYNLMLSLEEITLRRICVAMCNEASFLNKIAALELSEYGWCERREYFNLVLRNLPNLRLPKSLKRRMIPILKAVCDEIFRWKFFHESYLKGDICVRVLEKLRWTTAGTVNYQKTAEQLVLSSSDELPNVANRFELACYYCLEDYIPALWRELPEENKTAFYDGDISQIEEPHLKLFLPLILEIRESKLRDRRLSDYLDDVHSHNSFECAALLGNKTLARYCFAQLADQEKEASLARAARIVMDIRDETEYFYPTLYYREIFLSDVFCYLLSLMTAEEQIEIFKELRLDVIKCFLDWPCQDLFLDIVDAFWAFLPESEYGSLLVTIKDVFYDTDCYFPTLFQDFFLRSPVSFVKQFVDYECEEYGGCYFLKFAGNEDSETIRVVLRNLDADDRVRMVFSGLGLRLIYQRFHKWPPVEVFLREAALTQEEKQRLKEAFTEYVREEGGIQWINRRKFVTFFEFVDEGDANAQSKRSWEDEILTEMRHLFTEIEENCSQ